jgi:pyrroline-5-carboxylate reductase
MIGGMIQKGVVSADDILVSVRTEKSVERLTNQFGVQATMENEAVVAGSDLVFLAVKPNQIKNIINLVKNFISPEKIIVSILPGKSLQWLGTEIGKPTKLIRTMPNTPALVGEGMTGVCANDLVTEEELQLVLTLLKSFGRAEVVPEYLMDTVTGVSGSSPAYVFLFLEALADAAVAEGMPRKQAYEFAAQSVLGSAKMLLETGMHPGELKDMVCSPGGTTIEAVAVLERENLRSAVIDATRACIRKSKGVD